MEDAMAAGAWPEKENPNTTRINEIIDYVKQVRRSGINGPRFRQFSKSDFQLYLGFLESSVFSPCKTK